MSRHSPMGQPRIRTEFQGGLYTGDATSLAAINKPFWAKITDFDGSRLYSWDEYYPDNTLTMTFLEGGKFGTTTVHPAWEINGEYVPDGTFVLLREAYWDAIYQQTYCIVWGAGCCGDPSSYIVPEFTTDQDNLDLTSNWADVFLVSSTTAVNVSGLVPPFIPGPHQVIVIELVNVGSEPITFTFQDSGSTTVNWFLIPGGRPVTLQPLETISFTYTSLLTGWVMGCCVTGNYWPDGMPTPVIAETPTGVINSSNVTFTLAHTPVGSVPGTTPTLDVYLNGIWQVPGTDYTLSGSTITFSTPPPTGATLRVTYFAVIPTTYTGIYTTTSVLTADPPLSYPGLPTTLTLTTTYAGGVNPTGTVEFFDGVTSLGAGTSPSGSAGVVTSTLATTFAAGAHSLTAVFTGTGLFASSTSAPVVQTVAVDTRGSNVACAHPVTGTWYSVLVPGAPTSTPTILGIPTATGDLVVVWVARENSLSVSGVTWNGHALTARDTITMPSGPNYKLASLSYAVATGATGSVVVTLSGSSTNYAVVVAVFSNSGVGITFNAGGNHDGTGAVLTQGANVTACQLATIAAVDDLADGIATSNTWTNFYRIARLNAGNSMDLDVGWVQCVSNGSLVATLTFSGSCNYGSIYDQYDT